MPPKVPAGFQDQLAVFKLRALRIITWPWRAFRKICYYVGLIVVIIGFILSLIGFHFFSTLPKIEALKFEDFKAMAQKRTSERRQGKGPKPVWIPISKVSKPYLYSIVTSEDAQFFDHDGIELDSIVASSLNNLRKRKVESGASTLSQQVVKNIFLTPERTISRKLRELVLTTRMEERLSKNEILELYLNLIEVGPDMYGIGVAAEYYFRKKPSEINAAEGAFIALMLPSPRKFHYMLFENRNLPRDKARKLRRVLSDLLVQDFITHQQYREYIRYPFFKYAPKAIK
ncbi:MAG: transglycosylase domain-containing protein [Bdellovibrionales bacterium]|nr:transglycosylase domain-containing protein [Bdellovibrionales bacterium]